MLRWCTAESAEWLYAPCRKRFRSKRVQLAATGDRRRFRFYGFQTEDETSWQTALHELTSISIHHERARRFTSPTMSPGSALTLDSLVERLRQTERICFVPNAGNAGDAVIALGTFHFFDRNNLSFPTIVPQSEKERIRDFDLVLFSGGGNLVPYYRDGIALLQYAAALGKHIVVLPHSAFGLEKALVEIADNLSFFAREKASFERLCAAGFPQDRLAVEDDMAFWIDEGFLASFRHEPRRKTAYCLRMDQESRAGFSPITSENVDISSTWVGDIWQSRQFVESVVRSLASYLVQFESIVTDRLHIAVLASLLKLPVRLLPNSYYKNSAVFLHSMKDRFPKTEFASSDRRIAEDAKPHSIPSASRQPAEGAREPLLSAIICTHDRYDMLPIAIQSLLEQDLYPQKIEIIVVDNSSNEKKAAAFAKRYAGRYDFRYVYHPTPGLSNARNIGAKLARAPIIAYIDDDAIASPTWAREIVASYEKFGDSVAAVGGPVRARWLKPRPEWLTADLEHFFSILDRGDSYQELGWGNYLVGCNLSFRRSAIPAEGFSTELGRRGMVSLLSNEENHVLDVLRAHGKKIIYSPHAQVEHQIDVSRVNSNWLRRRMAWQAVSDVLSEPAAAVNQASGLSVMDAILFFWELICSRRPTRYAGLRRLYNFSLFILCRGG